MTTNPYKNGTPEWQLFANMQAHEAGTHGALADMERARERAFACEQAADLYREALEKLTGAA